jgi:hypothetical protein
MTPKEQLELARKNLQTCQERFGKFRREGQEDWVLNIWRNELYKSLDAMWEAQNRVARYRRYRALTAGTLSPHLHQMFEIIGAEIFR